MEDAGFAADNCDQRTAKRDADREAQHEMIGGWFGDFFLPLLQCAVLAIRRVDLLRENDALVRVAADHCARNDERQLAAAGRHPSSTRRERNPRFGLDAIEVLDEGAAGRSGRLDREPEISERPCDRRRIALQRR